jgi:hypothetical protein
MSPQTCTNCGGELTSGQRLCPACGSAVAAAPTEAISAPATKKTRKRGWGLVLVGGGGLVLLTCICIAVFGGGALLLDTGAAPVASPHRDYEAGEYFIELIEQTNWGGREVYPQQTFSDFAAEVQVRFETDVESVRGGLVWRYQDEPSYYYFNIRNTGRYALLKYLDGEWQTLIPATYSPHINTGIATNNLEVVAADDLISLYVNDQHLADFTDSSFSEGKIGLLAEVLAESPLTTRVFFDNLRVTTATEPSVVLFEDDFDDPESGWRVAEADTHRVGYVSASEAVAASEPVEVVSERELTTEEFFQAIEGDERFAEVYDLASEQGYTEAGVATEVILSNATVLSGLALGSPQDEVIIAIQAATDERSSSLLLRYENETVVLYDRQGRLELTEQGVAVFDAAGDPIGETEFPVSWRPPALASALQQQPCITGRWHEIKTCLGGWLGTGGISAVCAGSIGTAQATCPATLSPAALVAAPGCAAALLTATGSCAFGAGCLYYSGDDPPTLTPTMCEKAETPPTLDCWGLHGREVVVELQDWECGVKVEDDRMKPPPDPDPVTMRCGLLEKVEVRDCGGNVATLTLVAPDCEVVETCSHSCEEGRCQEPVVPPRPTPLPPEPTGKPVIRIWLDGVEHDEVVVIPEGFCIELRWEVQGATEVYFDGAPVLPTGTKRLCPTESATTYRLEAEGPGGTDFKEVEFELWDDFEP